MANVWSTPDLLRPTERPGAAHRFGAAVEWWLRRNLDGIPCEGLFRVSDDWLLLASDLQACEQLWHKTMVTLEEFGFVANRLPGKSVAPCQCLTWCGLEYDSVGMTVRLPADKVRKALALAEHFRTAGTATRAELDSLFGYMVFCSAVVFGIKAFLHSVRRLRYRSELTTLPGSRLVRIPESVRLDMQWVVNNLAKFNGDRRVPIVASGWSGPFSEAFIDARGASGGVGIFLEGAFVGLTGAQCNAMFPAGGPISSPGTWDVPSEVANHWELFAFVVLLYLFGPVLVNQVLRVQSDSVTAIRCVRDVSAALDSPELAALTKIFLTLCVDYNIRVEACHIPGDRNILADPLSR